MSVFGEPAESLLNLEDVGGGCEAGRADIIPALCDLNSSLQAASRSLTLSMMTHVDHKYHQAGTS